MQEALCCLDNPTPNPGAEPGHHTPMMITDHDLKTPDDNLTPNPGAEPEDCTPMMNTDHGLKTPDDAIKDYMNSRAPNDEQMEQALQTYQGLTS